MHASTGGSFAVPCLTFLTSPVPQWLWETFSSCAGGNNVFAARAYNKTAGILAAYPKKVEAGKELKSVQGIGKGSMDKVAHVMLYNKQKICSIAMLIRLARHAYLSSTVTVLCLDASQLPSHAFTVAVIWASQSPSSVLCFTTAFSSFHCCCNWASCTFSCKPAHSCTE